MENMKVRIFYVLDKDGMAKLITEQINTFLEDIIFVQATATADRVFIFYKDKPIKPMEKAQELLEESNGS